MDLETRSSKRYVTPFQGNFTIRCQEGEPNSLTRTTEGGKTIHYKVYQSVSGKIIKLSSSEKEFGNKKIKNLNIELQGSKGDLGVLSLPLSSKSMTGAFYNIMENIDFTKNVKFSISRKEDRDRLFISQNDTPLKWKYTKDNQQGKPQWEMKTIDGETRWDNTAEMAFFGKIIKEAILPKIEAANKDDFLTSNAIDSMPKEEPKKAAQVAGSIYPSNGDDNFPSTDDIGDLPF